MRAARGFTRCRGARLSLPSRRSHRVLAAKHKQEEICGENTEEQRGKRGRRPKENNEKGTAWFVKRVGGYNIQFHLTSGLDCWSKCFKLQSVFFVKDSS